MTNNEAVSLVEEGSEVTALSLNLIMCERLIAYAADVKVEIRLPHNRSQDIVRVSLTILNHADYEHVEIIVHFHCECFHICCICCYQCVEGEIEIEIFIVLICEIVPAQYKLS